MLSPPSPRPFSPSCIVVSVSVVSTSSTWIHLHFLLRVSRVSTSLLTVISLCSSFFPMSLLPSPPSSSYRAGDQIIRFPSASRMAIIASLLPRERKRGSFLPLFSLSALQIGWSFYFTLIRRVSNSLLLTMYEVRKSFRATLSPSR